MPRIRLRNGICEYGIAASGRALTNLSGQTLFVV
jgi:hypothetical protein